MRKDQVEIGYDPRKQLWTLKEDLSVSVADRTIVVPQGFETDLATIPRLLRWFINTFELGLSAPIVHDYLYVKRGVFNDDGDPVSRLQSDQMFALIMMRDGVAFWRVACSYAAVRVFGRIWWSDDEQPS